MYWVAIGVHKTWHKLTSCVAGVESISRVHALDAAEQMHLLIFITHNVLLAPNHHMSHCKGGIDVVDLSIQ